MLDHLANGIDDGPNSDQLVPDYPSADWKKPVPTISEENKQRVKKIIHKLTDYVKNYLNPKSSGTATPKPEPILILETNDGFLNNKMALVIPSIPEASGTCLSRPIRTKREASEEVDSSYFDNPLYLIFNYDTNGPNELNRDILNDLNREYEASSKKIGLMEYVQEELKNSSSKASKYLNQACQKRYDDNKSSMQSFGPKLRKYACKALLAASIIGLFFLDRCDGPIPEHKLT